MNERWLHMEVQLYLPYHYFNTACVGQPYYGKLRLHNMLSIGN